jgi:hypothetical protein
LKMEAISSSETSDDARSTQRHIAEDDILHSHRCESLKSYVQTEVKFPCALVSTMPRKRGGVVPLIVNLGITLSC